MLEDPLGAAGRAAPRRLLRGTAKQRVNGKHPGHVLEHFRAQRFSGRLIPANVGDAGLSLVCCRWEGQRHMNYA